MPEDEKIKRENLFATEIDDTVYYFTAERPTKENDLVLVYDKLDGEFKFLKNCDVKDTYLIIGTALKKMISFY